MTEVSSAHSSGTSPGGSAPGDPWLPPVGGGWLLLPGWLPALAGRGGSGSARSSSRQAGWCSTRLMSSPRQQESSSTQASSSPRSWITPAAGARASTCIT